MTTRGADSVGMSWRGALVEAAVIALAGGAIGLAVNLLRPEPLPWRASFPYETLVPCPEPIGDAAPMLPDDPALDDPRTVLVSALDAAASRALPLPPRLVIPYDYLDEVPMADVKAVAAVRGTRVLVIGDGQRPDSGEQLARELAWRGVRNVFFVQGGAPALTAARGDSR